MKPESFIYFLLPLFFFFSCREKTRSEFNNSEENKSKIKYARRFAFEKKENCTLVYLFGNRANADTTATYLLYDSTQNLQDLPAADFRIKIPCEKIIALSSIYANMLNDLNALERVIAIDNIDYITTNTIIQKHKRGELKEVARGPEPDIEACVLLKPDIIFTFGMGDPKQDVQSKLIKSKIPVAVSIDHLEETPLARAEWIKFFALFVNKGTEADSIFNKVEKNYAELKSLAETASERPSVFSEIKYSETWYVPGGNSFMAQLLRDAAASYIWSDDKSSGSLTLGFEQVYLKAGKADYWINLSMVTSKEQLLKQESRYDQFMAFQKGNLFNNNKNVNAFGYSDYWESGMIYPNRILSDLIQIFHPGLKNQIKNDLYYYRQIK